MSAGVRIGIYAPNMVGGNPSGVERYVRGLVDGLRVLDGPEEYVMLTDGPVPASPRWRRVEVPTSGRARRLWFDHRELARVARREQIDLLHCPKSIVPAGLDCPAILTIHDLIFLRRPEEYGRLWRAYWSRTIRSSAVRAGALVCHSAAVRRDVEVLLPEASGKIHVVPSGVDANRFGRPVPDGAARRLRLGAEPPYFLFVGNLTRRKNLRLLIEAHARIPEASGVGLVVAGARDFGAPEILACLREAGRVRRVRHVERPDDEDLAALYQGALALVHPSRDEGFAFPLLEAMAAGCPVLASTAGAVPEVAGTAALLASPDDVGAFAGGMSRLAGEAGLRADLAARGRARVAAYTWTRTAESTLLLYRETAERGVH